MSGSFPHKSSRVASSDHFRISFLCPVAEEGDKEGKEDKEEKEKSDSKSDKSEDKEDGVSFFFCAGLKTSLGMEFGKSWREPQAVLSEFVNKDFGLACSLWDLAER